MTRTLRSALQASDSSPRSKSLSQQITHSSKVVQLFKYYRSRFLLHARPTYSRLIYIAILFDIRLPVRTPICTTFSIYFHSREMLLLVTKLRVGAHVATFSIYVTPPHLLRLLWHSQPICESDCRSSHDVAWLVRAKGRPTLR